MEKIIVLGNGGHAGSLIDSIERENKYEVAGYVVNDPKQATGERYPILGQDVDLERIFQSGITKAAMGVGFMGRSDLREKLWRNLKEIGFSLPVICDPSAVLARDIKIGEGTFIGKGSIINAHAVVGEMCIVNTGAVIEHDCEVGSFSHISVGSVLCGSVKVGAASMIGANATVIQERRIGSQCIVGAGTTVRKNLKDGQMLCAREKYIMGDVQRLL